MTYNFDKIIDRTGSGDLKHSVLKERYGRDDLLPLWVAAMDFETPDFITKALQQRLEHSLFGYTVVPDELWISIIQWIQEHHDWRVRREWLTYIPGIVKGIGMAINVFVKENEKVIIQPPVYHPFRLTPQGNGRQVVLNPLKELSDGSYEMDFEQLAEVTDKQCRLLILSLRGRSLEAVIVAVALGSTITVVLVAAAIAASAALAFTSDELYIVYHDFQGIVSNIRVIAVLVVIVPE